MMTTGLFGDPRIHQPVEHSIIELLVQPGMMECLRQSLMNDPAIQAQANQSPMDITIQDLEKSPKQAALEGGLQALQNPDKNTTGTVKL